MCHDVIALGESRHSVFFIDEDRHAALTAHRFNLVTLGFRRGHVVRDILEIEIAQFLLDLSTKWTPWQSVEF